MAKRPNRHGQSVRASRGRGLNVWTTVLSLSGGITAGGATAFDIVQDADWVPSAGTAKATILRIRGWMSVINKDTTGSFAGGAVLAYIGMFDEDTLSPSGTLPSTYTDEDIMWTAGREFPFTDSGASGLSWLQDVDVKAQRRMRNGVDCRLVIANDMSVSIDVTFVVRALLRRGS